MLREQAAEGARRIDPTSEEGHAAARRAVKILGAINDLEERRMLLRMAVWTVALLALLSVAAILWILFRSDSPPAAQIVSIPTVLTAFATFAWAILRRADELRSPGDADAEEDAERAAPPDPLTWLRGLRR